MVSKSRRPLIVANWKMHKTLAEAAQFIANLAPRVADSQADIFIAAPYTLLHAVAQSCRATQITPGAQNMNEHDEGPFTGEISGRMLVDAGAKFVLLGHSERRTRYHESNELIQKKIRKALEMQLKPILCIGETAEERQEGKTYPILTDQLRKGFEHLPPNAADHLMLAYEPVWAIGTSLTASPEAAQEVHAFCREFLAQQFGEKACQKMRILYGGSVKADNAAQLMEKQDIDGLLVGNASLSVEAFEQIVNNSNVGN